MSNHPRIRQKSSTTSKILGTLDWQFFHESEVSTNPLVNAHHLPKHGRRSVKPESTRNLDILRHTTDTTLPTPSITLTTTAESTADNRLASGHNHSANDLYTHPFDVKSLKHVSLLNPPVDDTARPTASVPMNLIIAAFAQIQGISCDTAARMLIAPQDNVDTSTSNVAEMSAQIPMQEASIDLDAPLSQLQLDDVSVAAVRKISDEMARVESAWMHATLNGRNSEVVPAAAVQHWIMDAGWLNDEDMRDDFDVDDALDEDGGVSSSSDNPMSGKDAIIWRETSRVLPIRDVSIELRLLLERDPDASEDCESLDAAYVCEKEALASGIAIRPKDKLLNAQHEKKTKTGMSSARASTGNLHDIALIPTDGDNPGSDGSRKCTEVTPSGNLHSEREKIRQACKKARDQLALTRVEEQKALERVKRRENYGVWHIPAKHWEARLKEKIEVASFDSSGEVLPKDMEITNTTPTVTNITTNATSNAKFSTGTKMRTNSTGTGMGTMSGKTPKIPMLSINGVLTVPNSAIHGGNTTRYLNAHKIYEDEDADLDFEITVFQPGQQKKDLFAHYKR